VLAAKVDYSAGSNIRSLAIGDLTGDGKLDVIGGKDSGAAISVFKNNGDGTFAAKVDYSSRGQARSVGMADLNGDGKLDIFNANFIYASVSVFYNIATPTLSAKASTGFVGIGTSSPTSLLNLYSTATTTLSVDSGSANKGSCLKMKDSDGVGYTYCTFNDGAMSCSITPCD
jgi:hypothetical protein